jgi:DNA modification methylase
MKSRTPRPRFDRPAPERQVTTLWDYPSQNYGEGKQGDTAYVGATPSYIVWNLLQSYTKEKDLVVDPMCGSGTTLDVARDLSRRALGYDLNPTRPDIFRVDARKLPLETGKADFVFIDPPYSTHVDYSNDPRCIGKLDAATAAYYEAMALVIGEIDRVLKPGKFMALYVCDSFVKDKAFHPIGFELFGLLRQHFTPVDIVSVVRHNKTLEMGNYRRAADEGNFFLRGFNYLFIMRKEHAPPPPAPSRPAPGHRAAKKPNFRRGGKRGN